MTEQQPELLPVQKKEGVSQGFIQTKLTVGAPDDPFEKEADAVAEKVMRMPQDNFVQRKCHHCDEEEKKQLQRKPVFSSFLQTHSNSNGTPVVGNAVSSKIESSRGRGTNMDASTLSFMSSRFGAGFESVRIHTDSEAVQMNRELNAHAFTVGNDIYFNEGQYQPGSDTGKNLLAHELTHTLQQANGLKQIQGRFRLSELMPATGTAPSNPIAAAPETYFFRGSTANTTNRKAVVIGGIHGTEASAINLSIEALNELTSRTLLPDFHTVFVLVHRTATGTRSSGRGTTRVTDLNREFGTGYTSPNPNANVITDVINEFDPERVLSIHAISSASKGGVYLDPIHARLTPRPGESGVSVDVRSYPPITTAAERQNAFTGNAANLDAMHLTEQMINDTNTAGGSTPGNTPRTGFNASTYPGTGAGNSAFSLIYPKQGSVNTGTPTSTSLGTWLSGYDKTVITIEVPGYTSGATVYRPFLPGVRTFLRIPSPASSTTTPTSGGSSTKPTVQEKIQRSMLQKQDAGTGTEEESEESIIDRIIELIESILRALEQVLNRPEALPHEAPPTNLPRRCTTFADVAAIDVRKAHWTGVIAGMPVADVISWIIGMTTPPAAAMSEARRQMDCLIFALQAAASRSGSSITLPAGSTFVHSAHRDFNAQRRIWERKFNFTGAPFDRITPAARRTCGSLLLASEVQWDPGNARHRVAWGADAPSTATPMPAGARALNDNEKQREILQASSAPGISRHHWGTDFDIVDPAMNPADWQTGGQFADEYSWLRRNAATYGFIQTFTATSGILGGYIEERWHWSYYPVAQALLEFAQTHQTDIETALHTQWGTNPQFSLIRRRWRDFVFNVNETPVF